MVETAVNFESIQISKFQAQTTKSIREPFESRSQNSVANSSKAGRAPQDFSSCFQQAIQSEVEIVRFKKKEMLDLVKHRAIPTVLAIISENLRTNPDPKSTLIIFEIVKMVSCAIQKEYTKAQEYDRVSRIYLE